MSGTQFIGFESIMVILEVSMLLWPCRTFQVYFCHFTGFRLFLSFQRFGDILGIF